MAQMWLVAVGCAKNGSKESYLNQLQSGLSSTGSPVFQFDVPDGDNSLKFGSFDDLIRLTDDIAKYDSQVEAIVRRLERMSYDVDPSKGADPMQDFKIISTNKKEPFQAYMKNWTWDDAKYPKSRGLQNNLTSLLANASKLDEEARIKSNGYNELKSAVANDEKKQTGNLASRDLAQVLTPEVVQKDDFVQTEHLTTLVVVLPTAGVEGFLATYQSYCEKVVPGSAKRFDGVAEEDTQVWRVVLFRSAVDAFMKKSREERIATVRVFEYSEEAYEKTKSQRAELKKACEAQEKVMMSFCKAAFSDAMVAWVHVKAMRVFVESVLRFGVPPTFGAYMIFPQENKLEAARKALGDTLGDWAKSTQGGADDEEDYFPYVSVTFNPFSAKSQS